MRVLILGASGQIGSVIFSGLENSYEVSGTSRKTYGNLLKFDPFKDDWSTLGKFDVLINCVGQIEPTAESSFHHIHVDLTSTIIANRGNIGNPRIVQISALGASANHQVDFLKTKGLADDLLLRHPDTAVIRPSIVCTHRTMLVKKMRMLSNLSRISFGFLPVPKGFLQTKVQPIMPQDLVALVRKACFDRSINVIEAVGPVPLSFGEIIQLLETNRGRRLRTLEIPRTPIDAVVKRLIVPLWPGVINSQQYDLLFNDNIADADKCSRLLGRAPIDSRAFFREEFSIN